MYIAYETILWPNDLDIKFLLLNSLFGSGKLTKNLDLDNCSYSRFDTVFDVRGTFSGSDGSRYGKNVIIFGADNSSFWHADNRKKDSLILGNCPTDSLSDTTLTTEAKQPIDSSE